MQVKVLFADKALAAFIAGVIPIAAFPQQFKGFAFHPGEGFYHVIRLGGAVGIDPHDDGAVVADGGFCLGIPGILRRHGRRAHAQKQDAYQDQRRYAHSFFHRFGNSFRIRFDGGTIITHLPVGQKGNLQRNPIPSKKRPYEKKKSGMMAILQSVQEKSMKTEGNRLLSAISRPIGGKRKGGPERGSSFACKAAPKGAGLRLPGPRSH